MLRSMFLSTTRAFMTPSPYIMGMGGRCTHDRAHRSHKTIHLAKLQNRDGVRRVLAGMGRGGGGLIDSNTRITTSRENI